MRGFYPLLLILVLLSSACRSLPAQEATAPPTEGIAATPSAEATPAPAAPKEIAAPSEKSAAPNGAPALLSKEEKAAQAARDTLEKAGYVATELYKELDLNQDGQPEQVLKIRKVDRPDDQRKENLAIFAYREEAPPYLFISNAIHMEELDALDLIDFNHDGFTDLLVRDNAYRACNSSVLYNNKGRFKEAYSSSTPGLCSPNSAPHFETVAGSKAMALIESQPLPDVSPCVEGYPQNKIFLWNGQRFVDSSGKVPAFDQKQKKLYQEALGKIKARSSELEQDLSRLPQLYMEYDCLQNAKKKYEALIKK